MRLPPATLLACAALAALPIPVPAAESATEARLREALRTATSQLRGIEDERAKWQASEAALQKEVEDLRQRLAAVERRSAGPGEGVMAELRRRIDEQAEASARAAEALARCEGSARAAAQAAQGAEAERARLAEEADALRKRLAASEARNVRMFHVGKSIIDWLREVGMDEALAAPDPFLGLKRVELENAALDLEDKLHEQRGKP
jgi:DNA repair exonuclease SbcCD ATPase subunit